MKKLFISLFILVLFVVGLPALLVGLAYDGSAMDAMPLSLYETDAVAKDMLYQELSETLDHVRSDMEADFQYDIQEDLLNIAIFNAIRGDDESEGINPGYLPDENCEDSSCLYIMEEVVSVGATDVFVRLQGVWVTLEADVLTGHVAIEVQYGDGFTYRSIIDVALELVDDEEAQVYRLKLDSIRLGSLPLPQGIFSTIIGLFNGDDAGDALPVGSMDWGNFEYTVDKSDIVDFVRDGSEDDAMMQLGAEILGVVFEERLLSFKLHEGYVRIEFMMSVVRNSPDTDIPSYLHTMRNADVIDATVFDYTQHLQNQFDQFVFNMALTNQTYFTITEATFNKILYYEMDGFRDTKWTFEYDDEAGNPQVILVNFEGLWFEFRTEEDHVYINIKALFDIDGIKSKLWIRADDTDSDLDDVYVLEFTEVSLGKEDGKDYLGIDQLDAFKAALADMEPFPFGYVNAEGQLVIDTSLLTEMMEDGSVEGNVAIDEVVIVSEGLRVYIKATNQDLQDILDAFTGALTDAFEDEDLLNTLDGVLDTTTDGPEKDTYDAVVAIQDKLDAGDEVSEEDVQDLFENFDALSTEAQADFIGAFYGIIGDNDSGLLDDYNDGFEQ